VAGNDSESPLFDERSQEIDGGLGGRRVEAAEGLVHEHDRRLGHERGSDLRLLHHATRIGADEIGSALVEPEAIEQLIDAGRARVVRPAPAAAQDPFEQLDGREVLGQLGPGVDEADLLEVAVWRVVHVEIAEVHGAARGVSLHGQETQERGLPRAVGPHEESQRPRRERPHEIVDDGRPVAVSFGQAIERKRVSHGA
jgi:hypothetical protein